MIYGKYPTVNCQENMISRRREIWSSWRRSDANRPTGHQKRY